MKTNSAALDSGRGTSDAAGTGTEPCDSRRTDERRANASFDVIGAFSGRRDVTGAFSGRATGRDGLPEGQRAGASGALPTPTVRSDAAPCAGVVR